MATIPRWSRHVNLQLIDDPQVAKILSPRSVERHCRQLGHQWRDSFWSPTTTVITFLLQVLDGAKTLRSAVALLLTRLAVQGETDVPSCDPTAYCQARKRLPGEVIYRLLSDVCHRMDTLVADTQAWLGHRVWVIDGTGVSMPDSAELQATFPQPPGQRPGCGFPVAQIVAVFCWSTAPCSTWSSIPFARMN